MDKSTINGLCSIATVSLPEGKYQSTAPHSAFVFVHLHLRWVNVPQDNDVAETAAEAQDWAPKDSVRRSGALFQ